MVPLRTLRVALVLALLAASARSWSDGYLSGAELTQLYNSGVHLAERMETRLGSSSSAIGPFSHSGVRVTLSDGTKWLVHKGMNYGVSSETVVTRAESLGSDWSVEQTKDFGGRKTVGDFVAIGGADYKFFRDNCHHAAGRMMDQ